MDRRSAQTLIETTFTNSFQEERFRYFTINLFNEIDETKAFPYLHGQYIKDSFKNHVRKYRRLGTYTDPSGEKIDVLIVHLKNPWALERSRTMLRNFAANYLKKRGEKDAALIAYHTDNMKDWRFSLVRMEYREEIAESGKIKVKEELTPARRYSYLVGENEPNHTAQAQLLPILINDKKDPTLKVIENAFSVDNVTKQFYKDYRNLFEKLTAAMNSILGKDDKIRAEFEMKSIDAANFSKKLLGQIVFLYFLQKKGWLGVGKDELGNFKQWGSGSKNFLRRLFDGKYTNYKNFYNEVLEPLFYEALATERRDDYYSPFNCKIPFLNGGLFEPINDYDWRQTDILISNSLFTEIFKTFDQYNFTVREDEPLEKEVAVDPEMLGKVFENLLPENLRKGKGTYYTPRTIVHYMCQESLINYLKTECEAVPQEDIETLIREGEIILELETAIEQGTKSYKSVLMDSIKENAQALDYALANIKICDPAIGSGAFPVGMLNEIVKARNVLSIYLSMEPIDHVNGASTRMMQSKGRSIYQFKRHCIQESLYGVDIDPGAIDIAKLRLWLSLVVDEDDYHTIQPLPNLDYKIMQGNSLIEEFHGISLDIEKKKEQLDLYGNVSELDRLIDDLHRKQNDFFNATHPTEKQKRKKDVELAIFNIFHHEIQKKKQVSPREAEEIEKELREMTHGNKERNFFPWKLYFADVFREKGGFDVVIANPPYISHDKMEDKEIIKTIFKSYEPFADIYCYFIELAILLQSNNGNLCFITSNSYLKAEYGKPLRKFIKKNNALIQIINVEDFQLFEFAIVNTAILLSNQKNINTSSQCLVINEPLTNVGDFALFVDRNKLFYEQDDFDPNSWSLVSKESLNIKEKIEARGVPLKELNTKIRLGIATGANYAFLIDENKKNNFRRKSPRNLEIIQPVLRGRDISRYGYKESGLYILLTKNGIDVKKEYPDIYEYLDSFGEKFKNRGAQGQHWSNLRPCSFFDDFQKEKIIWIELTDRNRFALCRDKIYLVNSAYFLLSPKDIIPEYLLAILNSKVINFYLNIIAGTSGMGTTRWINTYVSKFPIPFIPYKKQKEIFLKSSRIISTKNSNPQAKTSELEAEIDRMVYELYGLTEEEIAIVEESVSY